jgi:Bacterial RNA polymerase, alpha chain C terminal domain
MGSIEEVDLAISHGLDAGLIERIPPSREAIAWLEANRKVLPVRAYNAVVNEVYGGGPRTILGLAAMTDAEWLRIPNFGRRSLKELRKVLPGPINDKNLQTETERLFEQVANLRRIADGLEKAAWLLLAIQDGQKGK